MACRYGYGGVLYYIIYCIVLYFNVCGVRCIVRMQADIRNVAVLCATLSATYERVELEEVHSSTRQQERVETHDRMREKRAMEGYKGEGEGEGGSVFEVYINRAKQDKTWRQENG